MKYLQGLALLLLVPYCYSCANSVFTLIDVKENILPVIIVPEVLNKTETAALGVLITSIKTSTGTVLQVKRESEFKTSKKKLHLIYFGNTGAFKALKMPALKNDGFYILQKKKSIYISAQKGESILYAVYYFAEHYLNGFKPDERPAIFEEKNTVTLPVNLSVAEEPAFDFRQAYFPASNAAEYQFWHRTQHIENVWGSWGHNLNRLLFSSEKKPLPATAYALINGKRNKEQFCFSSVELYHRIVRSIKNEMERGNEGINWSVAPNDNSFICSCEKCKAVNGNTKSASNSVSLLINKLAADFPKLVITTLAYSTTIAPPTNIKLASNTIVMLSTIDYPKGISLERQNKFKQFNSLLSGWKAVCNSLYIWDYPIQYTNYFDVFPNLPAVQKDLQYFHKAGIKGVFEQGTETNYGIFAEWKCYAISKFLWNPALDMNNIRPAFFNEFYGSYGSTIEKFYTACENRLIKNKAGLDIYGNAELSSKAYLDYTELENIISYLRRSSAEAENKDARIYYNVHKLTVCLEILMMQYQRWKGIDIHGYATPNDSISWTIKPEIAERIAKLKKACIDDEISTMNEDGILIQDYLTEYESFLKTGVTTNLLWKKHVIFKNTFDVSESGHQNFTVTDGIYGTPDYSFNWLLFNNADMDIEIRDISVPSGRKLTTTFLNDPTHFIFLPKSIKIFMGNDEKSAKQTGIIFPEENQNMKAAIMSFSFDIDAASVQSKYLRIVAENYKTLPEWRHHPTRKPAIACDEINIR